MPRPCSIATLASLSFCLRISGVAQRDGAVTYGELAESERHVVAVAADLDKDCAVPAELTGDSGLERAVLLGLGEAVVELKCQTCSLFTGTETE